MWDRNIPLPTFPRDSLTEQTWKKDEDDDANESRHPLVQALRSRRQMLRMGPGEGNDSEQVRMCGARERVFLLQTRHIHFACLTIMNGFSVAGRRKGVDGLQYTCVPATLTARKEALRLSTGHQG